MKKIKLAVIGAGLRGTYIYGDFIERNKDVCEVVAVVEGKKNKRELFKKKFNISEDKAFDNVEEFFKNEKMADGVIICNYDSLHFKTASLALENEYEVLLEGPLSTNLDEIIRLEELCNEYEERIIVPAMPYRYSDFFIKIKKIINEKTLGQLININYNSYIGYEKFSHNYVRGNWRIDSDSATLMLTNSCYDLDMLIYLTESRCKKISSMGSLNHFKRETSEENMSEACERCGETETCPYCAQTIYLKDNKEINRGVHINPTKENMNKMIKDSIYGRCVYCCDNDTYDNVISILQFENNVTANLNIIAFSDKEDVEIRISFSHGELIGSMKNGKIQIKKFISPNEEIIKISEENLDDKLMNDYIEKIKNNNLLEDKVENNNTFYSHIVAFAGEFSNVSETVVNVDDFYRESIELTKSMSNILF